MQPAKRLHWNTVQTHVPAQMLEREFKRYSAYFRGWCQAFGEHEGIHCEESGVDWLIAENHLGLVLPKAMIKPLYREVLLQTEIPFLTFNATCVQVGELQLPIRKKHEKPALDSIKSILESSEEAHVYLTSHLMYGSGNRIITFSTRRPLSIIYKEIGAMRVRLA